MKEIYLDTVDSTNSEAKRRALSGESLPMLVVSEYQTAGRGRLGRSFYSPEGTGLYMSLAYLAGDKLENAVKVTSAAAVAVCRAIEKLADVKCMIKWVNDIYVENRKVCGILAEATRIEGKDLIVVGVGVNCTTRDFPEDIAHRAGSIGNVSKKDLARAICENILSLVENGGWIEEYRERSLALGREVSYGSQGNEKTSVAVAVGDSGELILADGSVLSTGEISLKIHS